ncbi:hypothetical protein IDH44_21435 [Paenibacillus sp. IB182496]|uniref:Nucleotidyltransferase-like protein n=1 Tax=Paenibacillus sabuli TaxID=2772509 RepID=A0A927BYI5_9BACL|nr:nucleotidyltransferase-like protein [Paenibacillus sabuli]MBD2847764.1 hypothetical protein [Paenibacillus sabuli]
MNQKWESIKAHYTAFFAQQEGVVGVIALERPYPFNPLDDEPELLVLAVVDKQWGGKPTEHAQIDGMRIVLRTVEIQRIERWLSTGRERAVIRWLRRGEILLDPRAYLRATRERMSELPEMLRERKTLVEFSDFLGSYLQAKHELHENHLLDAYSCLVRALQNWARMTLIEEGVMPEQTIWKQIRTYNTGLYKMYEELTVSVEPLDKRIELVLLGCEFSVMSRIKSCCVLLLRLLGSRELPWSIEELERHHELEGLSIDLSLLLQKLVKRGHIREIALLDGGLGEPGMLELRYGPLRGASMHQLRPT